MIYRANLVGSDTLPNEYSVYIGSRRVERLGADSPKEAYRYALRFIRRWGSGSTEITFPKGRVRITRGTWSAAPTRRQ